MQKWNFTIEGTPCTATFEHSRWSGKNKLIVNGTEQIIRPKFKESLSGMDVPFTLAGHQCHFVLMGSKADIAVDGVYLDSGKPYAPLKAIPAWAWVFVVLNFLIPVMTLGGALPILIAFAGSMVCARMSVKDGWNLALRLLVCVVITFAAWVAVILLVGALNSL